MWMNLGKHGIMRVAARVSTILCNGIDAIIPFADVDEEHAGCLLHGFDCNTKFGSHGGIGKLKGIEI